MTAYYNEIDPYAAEWLRNLIKAGHIADGIVDTRRIEDVTASDLVGFTQCHFFAGIGGWSLALRLAGWDDTRPVWTGSCPCQPFSSAGEGRGMDDDRHLWPAWFHLIGQCRPATIFGEQVEAAIAHGWLDLVQDDLEGIGYAFAPVGLPAAGIGAPHIRHRLWWVGSLADAQGVRHSQRELRHGDRSADTPKRSHEGGRQALVGLSRPSGGGANGPLANGDGDGRDARKPGVGHPKESAGGTHGNVADRRGIVGDATGERLEGGGDKPAHAIAEPPGKTRTTGPLAGFWADADWIACRDGKARPVEPGPVALADGIPEGMGQVRAAGDAEESTFPLAPRGKNHVGRLRGYGNAIVPPLAAEFISAFMEVMP